MGLCENKVPPKANGPNASSSVSLFGLTPFSDTILIQISMISHKQNRVKPAFLQLPSGELT